MDRKNFAFLVLDEAQQSLNWHRCTGPKPNLVPGMNVSVARSILNDAKRCGIDVEAFLAENAAGDRT